MGDEITSVRPARLMRFGDTTAAVQDALTQRSQRLREALIEYQVRCDPHYRIPTEETPEAVRAWADEVLELGRWVRALGETVESADCLPGTDGRPGDVEARMTTSTAWLSRTLPTRYRDLRWDQVTDPAARAADAEANKLLDLLLGASVGNTVTVSNVAVAKLIKLWPDLPPTTLTITVTRTQTEVLVFADGTLLSRESEMAFTRRLVMPRTVSAGWQTFAKWFNRASAALTFAGGAYSQWQADEGFSTGKRITRAGVTGLGAAAGSGVGGWAGGAAGGAAAGLLCGPTAPVCSPVLAFTGAAIGAVGGGIVGARLGTAANDRFIPKDDAKPAGHDRDQVIDIIGNADSRLVGSMNSVDQVTWRQAADLARAEAARTPDIASQLDRVLPAAPVVGSTPPSGTTTTTTRPPATTTTTLPERQR